jgi:hypothetical protein
VQHQTAPFVHRRVHVLTRTQRRDDQRHAVLATHLEVFFEPRIGLVNDQVDRERRAAADRRFGDLMQPLVQLTGRPGIERGEAADDAGAYLRDHQGRARDDEHRRCDDRETKPG